MRLSVLLLLCVLSSGAQAHDWYSKHHNPVSRAHCCGSYDCKPVPAHHVEMISNSYIYLPKNLSITRREALESPDHDFHICEYPIHYGPQQKLRCIFVPQVPGY